jgi:hypothetical protein
MPIAVVVALVAQLGSLSGMAWIQVPGAVTSATDRTDRAPTAFAADATVRPQDPREPAAPPPPARKADDARRGPTADAVEPYLAGWSSEPTMEYGGLVLASVQRLGSRLLGRSAAAREHPGLAAAWEIPLAQFLSIVTHEVNGHGGRGREFDLQPRYGFDLLRMAAYTGTLRSPTSRDEVVSISGAGTEADTVLASRLLADLARPGGADASTFALAAFGKLDLTLYAFLTSKPDSATGPDFQQQFHDGNDIANYLVARQVQRRNGSLDDLWNQVSAVDVTDPLIGKTYDAARVAALWNALDPMLITTGIQYARQHLGKGDARIRVPMLELGHGVGLTAGTRAYLAPSYVTRYVDVYVRVPFGVGSVYGRDLDSSVARAWGWGGSFTVTPAASRVSANVTAERWDEPRSDEHGAGRPGWHVSGEMRVPVGPRFGFQLTVGRKTAGFVPGRPVPEGTYAGVGVLVSPWK